MAYPKVVVIGGPSMVGKSSVARAIASQLGYGCISTDDIGLAIKSVTTSDTHPRAHAMDGIDLFDYYQSHSSHEMLEEGMRFHDEIWPGIEASIRAHASCSFPIVYEGWAMWPERVGKLLSEHDNVDAIWLTASDDLLSERVRATNRPYQTDSDKKLMVEKYLPRNIKYNRLMLDAVKQLGLRYIEVDVSDSVDDIASTILAMVER